MFKTISYIANICIRSAGFESTRAPLLIPINNTLRHLVKPRFLTNSSTVQNRGELLHFEILSEQKNKFPTIDGSNVELSDIKVTLAGENFLLNQTSLRDFCFCSRCMHSNSRQKLFTPRDFRRNKFSIREMTMLSGASEVFVIWTDDHESLYPIDLLRKIEHFSNSESSKWPTRKIFNFPDDDFYKPSARLGIKGKSWNVEEISSNMSTIEYKSLVGDVRKYEKDNIFNANKAIDDIKPEQMESMYELTKSLVTYGLARIVNVPEREQEILNVARSLAYERPTGYGTIFDVVVEPSDEINLAYSALEFDLHTDLPYRECMPGVQLLHCITNSQDGGDSYFSDGYSAARKLQQDYPQLFQVLTEFPTTFSVRDPYRDVKFRRQYPMVSLDYHGDIHEIHYSPFYLPPLGPREDVKMFYLAVDKFTQYLQSSEQKLITKMNPGDLYIFHNRRVLHGRSSYDPTRSKRFLQGCYMDWDEIMALYEKLHALKLDYV